MPDASAIVGKEHQDEQQAASRGRDHEEIGRDDLADVIPQERAPRLRWRRLAPPHILGDASLPDLDAQFAGEFSRLTSMGVAFTRQPTEAGPVTLAVFADTCGHLIQLYQPAAARPAH
jgi:hypothetical protein